MGTNFLVVALMVDQYVVMNRLFTQPHACRNTPRRVSTIR
jgi:hypothetical protein